MKKRVKEIELKYSQTVKGKWTQIAFKECKISFQEGDIHNASLLYDLAAANPLPS